MKKYVTAVFSDPAPGELAGELIGFRGRGLPNPRAVNHKAKAKNRQRRKLANAQKKRMRAKG